MLLYLASILDDSVIKCDEIINADAEDQSYDKETKTIWKKLICEEKDLYFTCLFITYNCIIDSYQLVFTVI